MTVYRNEPRRSPWVLVPPPPMFVLAFVAGLQLGHVVPVRLVPESAHAIARGAGIAVIALAALVLLPAPLLFALRRTTIVPHRPSRSLVTGGPYRFTRNPMYLALALLYIGAALLANTGWPLLFLAAPLWILQKKTIPFEEANLERVFGDGYRAYQRRVRRWI